MTREQAVALAVSKHIERCKAWWQFWTHAGTEPNDLTYGFHHGWFDREGHSVGPHEYAPGPTYDLD